MKEAKHFRIEELTPPGYQNWALLQDDLIDMADEIHDLLVEELGGEGVKVTMEVNTWLWGGKFKNRGWRPRICATGSQNSQHKLGNAIDFDVYVTKDGKKVRKDPDDIRALLRKWKAAGKLKNLGGLETGVNWVHCDCRPHEHLIEFGVPKKKESA